MNPCDRNGRTGTLALLCMLLAAPFSLEAQESPTAPAAPEIVTFPNGDLELAGELYVPAGAGPFPAIVYNHGSAPGMANSEAFARLGPVFAERGWVFFAPYRRGQGLSAEAGSYIGDTVAAARSAGARGALPWIAAGLAIALGGALVLLRGRPVPLRAAAVVAILAAGGVAYVSAGNGAGGVALIESLETDHVSDHRAALAWLERQSFVDTNRVATGGNSLGGIVTLLAATSGRYCAAFDASGAAQSWSDSTELRRRLARAARGARAPMLFFQAENDYSIEPSRILSREVENAGTASERIVYPAFGSTAAEGHAFAWQGGDVWADDVLGFLGRYCTTELVVAEGAFSVYSAFWPNLHHVLYSEAWRRRPNADDPSAALLPEPLTAELTADERAAWEAAVDYYDRRIANRPLLFGLDGTRRALVRAGAAAPAYLPDAQHREILLAAAPVYREHWWPAHDAANRAWIAEVLPRVAALSPEVPERLAELYTTPWFERDLRVDVVRVASTEGAYTALEPAPGHVTISSSDPTNQGWSGVEVVFHEASHALVRPVRIALQREVAGRPWTRDLWHAALFYLTGEVVRQALAARGLEYEPYLYSTGLFDRAWPAFREPLEAHWQPYVDGDSSLEEAVRAVAAEFPPPED